MGVLTLAMPSPVPCSVRVTEVRALSYTELCCLGDRRYYGPFRLPLHRPGLRCWPYTRACFRGYQPCHGCRRASPVARSAFAACRLLYAGAVPGCSRVHGPDCCLRPHSPGSARSVPYGLCFRRGRVRLMLRPAALLLLASTAGFRRTPEVDYRAPLAACPDGTSTRWSIGPSLGTQSGTKCGRRSADEVRWGRMAGWLRPPGCQPKGD
jgi:hypothetical protein